MQAYASSVVRRGRHYFSAPHPRLGIERRHTSAEADRQQQQQQLLMSVVKYIGGYALGPAVQRDLIGSSPSPLAYAGDGYGELEETVGGQQQQQLSQNNNKLKGARLDTGQVGRAGM